MQIELRIQKWWFRVDGSRPAFPVQCVDTQFPRVLALLCVLRFACVMRLGGPPVVIPFHSKPPSTKVMLADSLDKDFALYLYLSYCIFQFRVSAEWLTD